MSIVSCPVTGYHWEVLALSPLLPPTRFCTHWARLSNPTSQPLLPQQILQGESQILPVILISPCFFLAGLGDSWPIPFLPHSCTHAAQSCTTSLYSKFTVPDWGHGPHAALQAQCKTLNCNLVTLIAYLYGRQGKLGSPFSSKRPFFWLCFHAILWQGRFCLAGGTENTCSFPV